MFSGSTVVLTGVGREGQVGEAVARAFGAAGASLVLLDRSQDRVSARAAAFTAEGYAAQGYGCDLADPQSVAQVVDEITARVGGQIRALVHMAGGFAMSGPVRNSRVDEWNKQLTINLVTAYVTTRAFLPLLRHGSGAIVLFGSQAALPGAEPKELSAYAVAKTGVITLMRAIAVEERANGLRANAVAPASIRTAANEAAMGTGVGYVEREDVANAVLFLCSDAARAVTGQVIALS